MGKKVTSTIIEKLTFIGAKLWYNQDYFQPNFTASGRIQFKAFAIDFTFDYLGEYPFTELSLPSGKTQRIYFENVPSNLGKGCRWYFLCPETELRALKLYYQNGRFVHRQGLKNTFYKKQMEGKLYRAIRMLFSDIQRLQGTLPDDRCDFLLSRAGRNLAHLERATANKIITKHYDGSNRRVIFKNVEFIPVESA